MTRRITTAALLLASTLALAQQSVDTATPPETGRRYAVEMIIFSYAQLDSVGTEVFVPERAAGEADVPEFTDLEPVPAAPVPDATADESVALHFRLLADDEFTMQETWGRLSRLQAYDPLMHFGWIQETLPDVEPPALALDRFAAPPAGLEGTVSLEMSRYLHLGVDLSLAATPASSTPASTFYAANDTPSAYAPLRYTLREKRIMKNGEIRYYDHPQFGVIARVWRIDDAETAAARR